MPLFFILSGFTSGAVLTFSKWKQKLPKILKIYFLAMFMIILLSLEKLLIWNVSIYQIGVETLRGIFWGSNTYSAHAISTVGVMWFLIVFDGLKSYSIYYRYFLMISISELFLE